MFLHIITHTGSKEDFEKQVNAYINEPNDTFVAECNFQRNLFYPRRGMQFFDDLQETYTAFLLMDDMDPGADE